MYLHLCYTTDDNELHQLRRSNIPSFKNCDVVANKFHVLSRDLSLNVNSHCHLAEAKQTSFRSKKKTSLFIHTKDPNKAYNTCKHYRMVSCLSHSVVFKCLRLRPSTVQARPPCLHDVAWKQDWTTMTYLTHVVIVTARVA